MLKWTKVWPQSQAADHANKKAGSVTEVEATDTWQVTYNRAAYLNDNNNNFTSLFILTNHFLFFASQ